MKNKRLIFFISVLIVSLSMIAICASIIVPTIKFDNKKAGNGSTYVNKNYETNGGSQEDVKPSNDNSEDLQTGSLEFFINEQTISKTKNIVGETTMFTISFKVFVMNETNSEKTIRASAFTGSYDISEFASFYKLECNESENSKTIDSKESEDFDFSLTYVITDTEKFKDNQKYGLTINYMSDEIIFENV